MAVDETVAPSVGLPSLTDLDLPSLIDLYYSIDRTMTSDVVAMCSSYSEEKRSDRDSLAPVRLSRYVPIFRKVSTGRPIVQKKPRQRTSNLVRLKDELMQERIDKIPEMAKGRKFAKKPTRGLDDPTSGIERLRRVVDRISKIEQASCRYTHSQARNDGMESMGTHSKNLLQTAHTEDLAGSPHPLSITGSQHSALQQTGSSGDYIFFSQASHRYTHSQARTEGMGGMETNSEEPLETAHIKNLTGSPHPINGNQHSSLQQTESRSNLDMNTGNFAGTLGFGGDCMGSSRCMHSQERNEGMEGMETDLKNPFQTAYTEDLAVSPRPINGNQHSALEQTESMSNPSRNPKSRRKLCPCPIKGCHQIFMRTDYLRNHLRKGHHLRFKKGAWARVWMSKPENEGDCLAAIQLQAQENDLISSYALSTIDG